MNNLKLSTLIIAFVASGVSFSSIASESGSVSLSGTITPASCSFGAFSSVEQNINVNVADLKAQGLAYNAYQLPQVQRDVSISCDAAVPVAVTFTADKSVSSVVNAMAVAGSGGNLANSDPVYLASLGDIDGKPIGYYMLSIFPDYPETIHSIVSDDGGNSWSTGSGLPIKQNGTQLLGKGDKGKGPHRMNSVTFPILVNLAFNPEVIDSSRDAIKFNANTTVTLKYL